MQLALSRAIIRSSFMDGTTAIFYWALSFFTVPPVNQCMREIRWQLCLEPQLVKQSHSCFICLFIQQN